MNDELARHLRGSGVRNLLVLALFHAFARAFKGGAILGIEEPELFLHPHAQRSLMGQFEGLVAEGNQLFVSSHSATFLDITRPERIVVVECCPDDEDEFCTHVRTTTAAKLLAARQRLHPGKPITETSMRAFLRNIRTAEMAEPYFARLVIVAEGPSEREALPLLCAKLGLRFDEEGGFDHRRRRQDGDRHAGAGLPGPRNPDLCDFRQ